MCWLLGGFYSSQIAVPRQSCLLLVMVMEYVKQKFVHLVNLEVLSVQCALHNIYMAVDIVASSVIKLDSF